MTKKQSKLEFQFSRISHFMTLQLPGDPKNPFNVHKMASLELPNHFLVHFNRYKHPYKEPKLGAENLRLKMTHIKVFPKSEDARCNIPKRIKFQDISFSFR